MRHYTSILMVAVLLNLPGLAPAERPTAKYVFLMIGDGMGSAQRTLGRLCRPAETPDTHALAMDALPVAGLTTTHSADSLVTDSAAAGTAIATGRKTANGVLGMDPTGKTPYTSLADHARSRGLKVGLVSTVSLDHATPAAFYAHQPSRDDYGDIAMQLPPSGIDFLGGGSLKGRAEKHRLGRPDPFDALTQAGYRIARTRAELRALQPGRKACYFCDEVDADAAMLYALDRATTTPDLAEITAQAIRLLDNPRGFFLMVEGGRIDWACHENDPATTAAEVLDFDAAVAVAMAFYRNHPDETLVVVTADHETGGLGLGNSDLGYRMNPSLLFRQATSAWQFARTAVARFRNHQTPLEDALPVILETFGFERLTREELRDLTEAYRASLAGLPMEKRTSQQLRRWGKYDPLAATCVRLVARHAGLGWTTLKHTGLPVPTSAAGVQAASFGGVYDNTDLFRKILAALPHVPPNQPSATRPNAQAHGSQAVNCQPTPPEPALLVNSSRETNPPAHETTLIPTRGLQQNPSSCSPHTETATPQGTPAPRLERSERPDTSNPPPPTASGGDSSPPSSQADSMEWDTDWLALPGAILLGLAAVGVFCLLLIKAR